MIKSISEYITERTNGIMPMVGRDRYRAEYYVTCLQEFKRGELIPCWYEGEPAMCTEDEIERDDVINVTWSQFFTYATQDIQHAISRNWAFKVGDGLLLSRQIPDTKQIAAEVVRGTKLDAFDWLQQLRREIKENE